LHKQIDVVRSRRVARPTPGLQTLERRVLGNASVRREVQRLDTTQLTPAVTLTFAQPASPAASMWRPSVSLSNSLSLSLSAPSTSTYAPEFSARDTGRFRVEPFAAGLDAGALFSADPVAAVGYPAQPAPSQVVAPGTYLDDSNWLARAQAEQPQKITTASKRSLNSGLALAKDDFERELATILGREAAPAVTPAEASAPSAASPVQAPAAPASGASAPARHPNHEVFDQMGLGMRYANSFDLGNVSLSNSFSRLEADLGLTPPSTGRSAVAAANPYVNPMNLDEFDLVAELAHIGAERPASTSMTHATSDTEPTAGKDHG
jgi:hypothetical protein